MSKAAIKNFFQHHRDVVAQQAVRREERRKQRLEEKKVEEDPFKGEVVETHGLLKRNWFLTEDCVIGLLWELDEIGFQEIVKRKSEYDVDIRQIIERFLPKEEAYLSRLKFKIRDISTTDEEDEDAEIEKEKQRKKDMKEAWESYRTDFEITPPVGEEAVKLKKIESDLEKAKVDLEDAKKKSVGDKYVAPAAREFIIANNPKVVELQKKIQNLELSITFQKQCIEKENELWFLIERYEFDMAYIRTHRSL